MPKELVLFQWDSETAQTRAAALRAAGWAVVVESSDGGRGVRMVLDRTPALIVVDLARRPSHSREVVGAIMKYRAIRHTPLLFVDGAQRDIDGARERVRHAVFTTSAELLQALSRFDA